MVLQAEHYGNVGYAQTGECYPKTSYPHQEEYYSKQEDYCSENGYYSSGSSMQQIKPYPYISTSQPLQHYVVGHEGYGQHNDGWYGIPQNDHNQPGYYDKYMKGKHHSDALYGRSQSYDGHGYAKFSNAPNKYPPMSHNYYPDGRDRCPPYYDHKSQQSWASKGAEWIAKSLDN